MTFQIIISILLITLALIFYSIGVWSERVARYLKPWHVVAFWIGFAFVVSETLAMRNLATTSFSLLDIHTLTGQIALWLMLFHAAWATRVTRKGSQKVRESFHTYSLIVWLIWLIPYFGGMFMGMR